MSVLNVTFQGHDGGELSARLDLPSGEMRGCAIFAHCFSCSKDIPAAKRISAKLAMLGIAVLRFDFTGLGHSQGEFENTNFSSNVQDLIAAAQYLRDNYTAPSLLVGHSLGGAAVLAAAPLIPEIKAVATIGAPSSPAHVAHLFSSHSEQIAKNGQAQVNLGGRPFTIKKQFLEDINAQNLTASLKSLKPAILVLHSPIDQIVGIENAAEIFTAARHPKSFITLDKADHLLTRPKDAEYAAEVISAWCARYLDLPSEPVKRESEGIVKVVEVDPKGFTQDIIIDGTHQLIADEPPAFGGKNLGPSPFQYLSAGLGACTNMTIRMYANRKSIPLENVIVEVHHDKKYAAGDKDEQGQKIDVFSRDIQLFGKLSDDDRANLLKIADRCPVHRTLEAQAHIETKLVET